MDVTGYDHLRLSHLVPSRSAPDAGLASLPVTSTSLDHHALGIERHTEAVAQAHRHHLEAVHVDIISQMHQTADAHRQHIDAVHFDIVTEVHRLRGEVLALRSEMKTSQAKVVEAMRGLRAPIRRVAGKVDDLWASDSGARRLVRRGVAKGADDRNGR